MKPNEMHYFFAAENWMELNLEKFANIIIHNNFWTQKDTPLSRVTVFYY